jgi:3'(2'), 5'-bisphosphate nucleotidase
MDNDHVLASPGFRKVEKYVTDYDGLWQELAGELTDVFGRYRRRIATLPVSTKPDKTLLTEADLEIEQLIAARIHEIDHGAVIIGEEDGRTDNRHEIDDSTKTVYVIDPIDGTAEFVRPDRREFASVVCVLKDFVPVAAFVLAPELGRDAGVLTITCDHSAGTVAVNGTEIAGREPVSGTARASVTRSSATEPKAFEAPLRAAGYELKTRTTSQTLDMVRAAVDLTPYSDGAPRFDLFVRSNQKVWDGLAGICLGETVGLRSADRSGARRVPVDVSILRAAEPTFDVTIMGVPEAVEWFLKIM